MDRRLFKNLDFTLLSVVGILIALGLVMVFSATHTNQYLTGNDPFAFVKRQFVAVLVGILGMFLLLFTDYRLSERMSQFLYVVNILMLLLVIILPGTERNGAKSWLFFFQPSEFSKIILIVTFGKYLAEKDSLNSFVDFIGPFIYMGIPLLLILLQPDVGTALVFIFFSFLMMYIAGAPGWKLLLVILAVIAAIALVFVAHHFWSAIPLPVKQYQIDRLTSFVDPKRDPQRSGWNLNQAIIAVGSGQFFGKGLFHGTQGRLGFLPEHHTDFIFAILCEELGFVGGFAVLFLFFTLIWRGIRIALQAKDKTGSLIAVGIVAMLLFHILENAGMNIGLMPITGIPLPFISFGGTAMIANLLAMGLLSNIWARHQKIMF